MTLRKLVPPTLHTRLAILGVAILLALIGASQARAVPAERNAWQDEANSTETPAMVETPLPVETVTETATLTGTLTETPLPVETATETPIPIETPTETATPIPTEIPTEPPVPVETATETPIAVETPTETATPIPTEIPIEPLVPVETPTPEPAGLMVLPTTLQGYWKLDELVGQRLDSSSFARHLTNHNTIGSLPGKAGLAADFEKGQQEYFSFADTSQNEFEPLNNSFSLVGWFNPESLSDYQMIAAKYDYGNNGRGYRLYLLGNNKIGLVVSPNGTYQDNYKLELTLPAALTPGAWHHLAGTFDAQQRSLSLYLDGQPLGSKAVSYNTVYNTTAPFTLGANLKSGTPTHFFDGLLDEWRFYTGSLSQTDIQTLMNGLAPTPTSTPINIPTNTPTPLNTPTATATSTPTPKPTSQPTPNIVCKYTISTQRSGADGRGSYSDVKPGDTICIAAGSRGQLILKNFRGTAQAPITFINFGGQVVINSTGNSGIIVYNSQYIHLTGTGSSDQYGFKVIGSTELGLFLGQKSSNFEVDHIEVANVPGVGIYSVDTATCSDGSNNQYDFDGDGQIKGDRDDVLNRSNFTQTNTVYHHNYVHNVGRSGIYLGSSFYAREQQINCASGSETRDDPVLVGVSVYDNLVEQTGMKGIQVGSALENCNIHHNKVSNYGQANVSGFQEGILNNPGSVCNIYNNVIKDGAGTGIFIQGNGKNQVYDNEIVNAGRTGPSGNGISIDTGSNPGNSIYVRRNTIITPKNVGIAYSNTKGNDNKIENNLIVAPGDYPTTGQKAYIQTSGLTNVTLSNNIFK